MKTAKENKKISKEYKFRHSTGNSNAFIRRDKLQQKKSHFMEVEVSELTDLETLE
jgi:hypothetical protein